MRRVSRFCTPVILAATAVAAVWTLPAGAGSCGVPSASHPTIQAAIDDVGCDPVVVAAGSFPEAVIVGRDLELQGAGSSQSFVLGGIEVQTGAVTVVGFHISGPGQPLWSHSGARVSGFDLVVVNGVVETPLFADGFESGGTGAWSAASP